MHVNRVRLLLWATMAAIPRSRASLTIASNLLQSRLGSSVKGGQNYTGWARGRLLGIVYLGNKRAYKHTVCCNWAATVFDFHE